MPRFFNRIRKQLSKENKFFQYSRYAIGEILLVVIGILIALQVNNWNQQREQQQTARRYLASLIEDVTADIDQFQRRNDQALFRFHSGQQILKWIGEAPVHLRPEEEISPLTPQNMIWPKPLPNEPDSLFLALSFLWSVRVASPGISRSTINEMMSTGAFSYLRNKRLKDAINYYYNDIDWRFGEEFKTHRQEKVDLWSNSLLESGVLAQDISKVEDPLDLIRNNTERIGYLRAIIRSAWFEAHSLNILQVQAHKRIQQIKKELEP
jgi:hypothetical protein